MSNNFQPQNVFNIATVAQQQLQQQQRTRLLFNYQQTVQAREASKTQNKINGFNIAR